jgi:hypothetical protein
MRHNSTMHSFIRSFVHSSQLMHIFHLCSLLESLKTKDDDLALAAQVRLRDCSVEYLRIEYFYISCF